MVLWSCVAAAYLAQWMLPVAAQWFLVDRPGGERLVPYVQVAMTLPMALLAIPAGVMADRFDRRLLVIGMQVVVLCGEVVLVGLALGGMLQPWSMFLLLALLASGIVVTFTSLSSMVPDMVSTPAIPQASALLTIAVNGTRVIGPALAGFILAAATIGVAFAATIPATVLLLLVLSLLKTPPRPVGMVQEGWVSAAALGLRFVRNSPQALKLIPRTFWFTFGVMALMSMLPVLATRLGAGASTLGLVLACQGAGAVLGAVTLSWLTTVARQNTIVTIGFLVAGLSVAIAAAAPHVIVLGAATVFAGWAWTTILATDQAALQVYLPGWVRARGISVMMIATFSGQALGSAVFGWIGGAVSLVWMLGLAAAWLLAGVAFGAWLPLKDLKGRDVTAVPTVATGGELVIDADRRRDRPLQVRTRYDVPFAAEGEFLDLMARVRRIRLRTGARRWQLLTDPSVDGRYYEEYMVASWVDHEMQIQMRTVADDRDRELAVHGLVHGEPETSYCFQVEVAGISSMRRQRD